MITIQYLIKPLTVWGKIYTMSWTTVVLILVASYTAQVSPHPQAFLQQGQHLLCKAAAVYCWCMGLWSQARQHVAGSSGLCQACDSLR